MVSQRLETFADINEPFRQRHIVRILKKKKCKITPNNLRKFSAASRVIFGRKAIEPHLPQSLTERNRSLSHLFTLKNLEIKVKPKKPKDVLKEKEEKGDPSTGKEGIKGKIKSKRDKENNPIEKTKGVKIMIEADAKDEDLDDNGYKTIIRPAVSFDSSSFLLLILSSIF